MNLKNYINVKNLFIAINTILLILFIQLISPYELLFATDLKKTNNSNKQVSSKSTKIISSIKINITNENKFKNLYNKIAKDLIFLKQGSVFSAEKLKESINVLKLCEEFDKVDVKITKEKNFIKLNFFLTPYLWIKDIEIDGNYPLFETQVLNAMTIYPGNPFKTDIFSNQKKLITNLYKRQGFINPKVKIKSKKNTIKNHIDIFIEIEHNKYFKLHEIKFKGNRSFSDIRLKAKMTTWWHSFFFGSSGRFIDATLKKDIKNLTKFYWEKNYPECTITYDFKKNDKNGNVYALININEGPKYRIEITQDMGFWNWNLNWRWEINDDIVLSKKGNKYDIGLNKSKRNIISSYKTNGYLNSKIKIIQKKEYINNFSYKNISLILNEGPQSVVDSIKIRGNHSIKTQEIENQILSSKKSFFNSGTFDPKILTEDILGIKAVYLKHGFTETKVTDIVKFKDNNKKVALLFSINEKTQTIISSVKINGAQILSKNQIKEAVKLKKGQPFRNYMVVSDKNALSNLISDMGYPYVEIKSKLIFSDDKKSVSITYDVFKNKYVKMGNIYVSGNQFTKEKFIKTLIGIKTNEPFSLSKILLGQNAIRNINIIRSVTFKTIGLKEQSDKITLFIDIEESNPYYVEAGLGFETQKGFFGATQVGDHNFLGDAMNAKLSGEISEVGYVGEIKLIDPFFLNKITATYSIYGEKEKEFNKTFGIIKYGGLTNFSHKLFSHVHTDLSINLERRNEYDVQITESTTASDYNELDQGPRTFISLTPSIRYNILDSSVRPTKGLLSSLSTGIFKGLGETLDDFLSYKLNVSYFSTPFSWLTLEWLAKINYIYSYNSDGIVPQDQLFFMGGTQSVRGFKENMLSYDSYGNSVGGKLAILGSMEAHIKLIGNFEFITFFDIGRVSDTFVEPVSNDFRYSAGPGIGYITPIGSIILEYGFKLNKLQNEDIGQLHFLIGYRF